MFYFSPLFGKIPILTNILQVGCFNHQPVTYLNHWACRSRVLARPTDEILQEFSALEYLYQDAQLYNVFDAWPENFLKALQSGPQINSFDISRDHNSTLKEVRF